MGVELVVLVCSECQLVFALQAEWIADIEPDEVVPCVYCGSELVGTLITQEVS